MDTDPANSITLHLQRLQAGDRRAMDELLPHVYDELRGLASRILGPGGPATLQPTVLVHEAYLRLIKHDGEGFSGRKHFYDVASMAMRQLLASYVRTRRALKRGGNRSREDLDEHSSAVLETLAEADDLIALDGALEELRTLDERHARIVELRYLTGLTIEETAEVLDISTRTVRRDWQMARAWLHRAIAERRGEWNQD